MSDHAEHGDCIHIEGLEVLAHVGVSEAERAAAQRLILNITYWPSQPTAALQDDITRGVDYAAVGAAAKTFVQSRSDRLIETMADALAAHLLEAFPIRQVTIELRKFILPEVKFVSVTVKRRANAG